MKITFLGTGTSYGIPVIGSDSPVSRSNDLKDKRLRSSCLISWSDTNLLIDCSPDFRQQMLTNEVRKLDAILFTHEHADHTAGLDDIRPFVLRQGDMPIYGKKSVIEQLKRRFEYIFATENRYPGAPSVKIFEIHSEIFSIFEKKIIPINVLHGTLPIFGYRIDNLAYITDAKYIPEEEFSKLENLDLLVINALRKEEHPTHFSLNETLDVIKKLRPKQSFLTHISQDMGFHEKVSKELPKNIFLAYDNLTLEF